MLILPNITKRLLNCCRLVVGYALSSVFRRPVVIHAPVFLSIEPVNVCNLHCPQCPTGMGMYRRSKRFFDMEAFARVLKEVGENLLCVQFYFQGEPLLCPSLCDMIKMAKAYGLYTVVSTNAQLLDDVAAKLVVSGLDKLIVSMDGISQEAYSSYRVGGDVTKVISGLRSVADWKKFHHQSTPCVELQWLVLRTNEAEMPIVRKQYKRLGANRLVFKTAQFYTVPKMDPLMPQSNRYNRYRCLLDGSWVLKRKLRNRCWRLWSGAVIDVEGNVRSCCFDKAGAYVLGNIYHASFNQIWHGEQAQKFRARILRHRSAIDICQNCTE